MHREKYKIGLKKIMFNNEKNKELSYRFKVHKCKQYIESGHISCIPFDITFLVYTFFLLSFLVL